MLWLYIDCSSVILRRQNASTIGEEGEDLGEDLEEEGRAEVREEEVQGQIANQGKPPLDAYLTHIVLLVHDYKFYKLHVFYSLCEWSYHSVFYYSTLTGAALVDTY